MTSGLEWNSFGSNQPDGQIPIGTVASDTGTVRTGSRSVKVTGGISNNRLTWNLITTTLGNDYYLRAFLNIPALPSATCEIFGMTTNSTTSENEAVIRMETNGTLTLWANIGGTTWTQQGSASPAVGLNVWQMVEFRLRVATGTIDQCEARYEGASFASGSSLNISDTAGILAAAVAAGINGQGNGGTGFVIYYDDIAINDSTGANQNSWPGFGKIVLLTPISDNARGANWVGGAAGTTNLWDALNNTPPVGVASASGTNTSQIHNVTKDTTGNYDANMTTYTTAGITQEDIITVVHPHWNIGGAATGDAMLLVSNPQANAGTESTASPGTTLGTYPTGWSWQQPSAQIVYNPSPTLGTSPVMRIGKRQNSTNEVGADAMGIYVEYIEHRPRRDLVQSIARRKADMARSVDW